jgi:hypothetical protein
MTRQACDDGEDNVSTLSSTYSFIRSINRLNTLLIDNERYLLNFGGVASAWNYIRGNTDVVDDWRLLHRDFAQWKFL